MYKVDFFLDPIEKMIYTNIIELDEFKLMAATKYDRKIGIYCSKLGSNCHILINLAEVIFWLEILIYFFSAYIFIQ